MLPTYDAACGSTRSGPQRPCADPGRLIAAIAMHAMVTGATGFVGQHLVRRLKQDGACVTAVVSHRGSVDADQVAADVGDTNAMCQLMEAQPDVVYHLAGAAARVPASGPGAFEVNSRGTAAVLEAIHRCGSSARVVLASTDAITTRAPADPYEQSKADAEDSAAFFRVERGLDIVTARLSNVYGPGDRSRQRLVPAAAAAAVAGVDFKPLAPASVLDLVHVADAVAALVLLGVHADAPIQRVASGRYVTVEDVVQYVGAIARGEAATEPVATPYESPVPVVPGWTPQISLARGLEETVRWYLERSLDPGAG